MHDRIITVQLEETFKHHLVKLPDYFRANQKLKRVIKAIVHMLVEQETSTTSLVSLFQCLTTFLIDKFLLLSSLKSPWHSSGSSGEKENAFLVQSVFIITIFLKGYQFISLKFNQHIPRFILVSVLQVFHK